MVRERRIARSVIVLRGWLPEMVCTEKKWERIADCVDGYGWIR